MDYDAIVIGSGFGGSVSALRLAEKGYRVVVLEQGRRIGPAEMQLAANSVRHFLWAPPLGMSGFFAQDFFRHVGIARGVAVGGGSIVYAAVLLQPEHDGFFGDPLWSSLGIGWRSELAPHYQTARRMLGVTSCPWEGTMDRYLQRTAEQMGVADSYGPTDLGIYFGKPGLQQSDPFFSGRGPARTGCTFCGECMSGCRHGAKNTLDRNYLYLAEQAGAEVRPLHRATAIRRLPADAGYEVQAVHPLDRKQRYRPLRARRVFLAAGVVGTLQLLFHCRDDLKSLPGISDQLGQVVRTNSESILAITEQQAPRDLTVGPAISSHFYANPSTHITMNRFPKAFEFMKYQTGPLVDGESRWRRSLATLGRMVSQPRTALANWLTPNWHKKVSALTVMQDRDNQLRFVWKRSALPPFRRSLRSERVAGQPAPSYIPEANQAAKAFARVTGGTPANSLSESLLGSSVTAHILGGCHMGHNASDGVIDTSHQLFGYPGMYVVDASAISANVGVNPSLTITAMAERCHSLISPHPSA